MSKKRGKGLLNKEESKREFTSNTAVKYSACMNPLLEGDKLKPGELNTLCCMKDFEAVTDFESMSEKEKDRHIYCYSANSLNTNRRNTCISGYVFSLLCTNKPYKQKLDGT